jgi:hypothetical protein
LRCEREAILNFVDVRDVVGVRGVNQHTCPERHVRGVEVLDRQVVGARLGEDLIDVVVLVDNHHRQVAVPGVGDRDGRPLGDVDDGQAVERVSVHPDDCLLIDRCGGAQVLPLAHAACVVLQAGEHPVRLSPDEVVVIDRDRHRNFLPLVSLGRTLLALIRPRLPS